MMIIIVMLSIIIILKRKVICSHAIHVINLKIISTLTEVNICENSDFERVNYRHKIRCRFKRWKERILEEDKTRVLFRGQQEGRPKSKERISELLRFRETMRWQIVRTMVVYPSVLAVAAVRWWAMSLNATNIVLRKLSSREIIEIFLTLHKKKFILHY